MKRVAYEVPGLELEGWLNGQIAKWEIESDIDRLAEGHIRALRSVLQHLTKMESYPEEKWENEE